MKRNLIFFLIISLTSLTACSWQEYFVISNMSDETAKVEYCITMNFGGFPLFENDPDFFRIAENGNINWEKNIEKELNSISDTIISFELNKKEAAIIGRLSNDHYTGYNQYFINGRVFNLNYINIISKTDTVRIIPESFDKYFSKVKGYITCTIKK